MTIQKQIDNLTAVILCGGQGTRMGSMTEQMPKPLLEVQGYPILWYIISRLHMSGIRHFVLPTGYLGEQIDEYVKSAFSGLDFEILCVDTGTNAPIGLRLHRIREYLPKEGNIFLTNGDALFDFDIVAMARLHSSANAAITFATIEIISQYGLVLINDTGVTGFERDSAVTSHQIRSESGTETGLVYAGICILDRRSLDLIDLAKTPNFEAQLFPKLISEERTRQFRIPGFWCSIDTQKDLAGANMGAGSNPQVALRTSQLKKILENSLIPR